MRQGGLVDMHAHFLPEMDDGSKSVEMSLAMLQKMSQMGISTVCATSHYYSDQNSIARYLERRTDALQKLKDAMPSGNKLPRILPAAEVAYFSGIEEHTPERLCIQGTKTLMLEMPFSDWTDKQVDTVAVLAMDMHLNVVLVHPERFCFSANNREKLKDIVTLPIALQVNADTLIRWRTRKLGLELLGLSNMPLLGSDCHDLKKRPPNLKGGRDVVLHKFGERFARNMNENACRLTASDLTAE